MDAIVKIPKKGAAFVAIKPLGKFHGHGQLHDSLAFDLVTCTGSSWAWP